MHRLKRLLSQKIPQMKRVHKRPFLLMEVLIAFSLIVMCVLPLIAPHTYILIQQKKFVHTVELDHLVNLLYADIVERMYIHDIPLADLLNGREFPVDEVHLQRLDYNKRLPYTGSYSFSEKRHKGESPYTLYLINLDFTFVPKGKEEPSEREIKRFHYKLFVVHDLREGKPE